MTLKTIIDLSDHQNEKSFTELTDKKIWSKENIIRDNFTSAESFNSAGSIEK